MKSQMTAQVRLIEPPNPYSALIFDCDGTLADTMPRHYEAWVQALSRYDAKFAESRFYEMAGMPSVDIIGLLNREQGYNLDARAVEIEKERLYFEVVHKVKEIEAVANIARAHFGKMPMAVASGGLRSVVLKTLETTGLRNLFEVIVTAEDVQRGKPAPDMFLLAAKRLGVAADECVVYEDADLGLEAAARAEMRAIDVRILWPKQALVKSLA